jgi:hypothetical protein
MDANSSDSLVDKLEESTLLAMVRPSWCDPRYALATSWTRHTQFNVIATQEAQVLTGSPLRWAVGFSTSSTSGLSLNLSNQSGVVLNFWDGLQTNTLRWYTLFQHGPFVCSPWYATPGVSGLLNVWEVLIQ